MKNLEGIRAGDRVYDAILKEWGRVAFINKHGDISVNFPNNTSNLYTEDGYWLAEDKQPRLFFDEVDFSKAYTEFPKRPEPKYEPKRGEVVWGWNTNREAASLCVFVKMENNEFKMLIRKNNWCYCKNVAPFNPETDL